MKTERISLEKKLKTLETNTNFTENSAYTEIKEKLDKIYQAKTNGIRIRSKCDWYKHGKKSSKILINLEKPYAVQNQIPKVFTDNKVVNDQKDINNNLHLFYKNLSREKQHLLEKDMNQYLSAVANFLNCQITILWNVKNVS